MTRSKKPTSPSIAERFRRGAAECLALAFGAGAAGAAPSSAAVEPAPVPLVYVASAGSNHIQVVDPESGETLRKIYAGATPWRLAVSPDGRQLWAQHWYSATTAVIDLDDHEIVGVLPVRGPGSFTPDGDRFLTFSWPRSTLHEYDAKSREKLSEQLTDLRNVYDLAPDREGGNLYLAQLDPMAGQGRKVYGYILSYPHEKGQSRAAVPISVPTGRSPAQIRVLRHHPFLLTADSETNGLSLINERRDGRAVPTCPAPRAILMSPDETRMLVACWRGQGARTSEVVRYVTDFSARPWPAVKQEHSLTVAGAVVAGAYSPAGDRVYLVDRTGDRLLEVDPETLEVLREVATGAEPVAVAVAAVSARARERLAGRESRARRIARRALARLQEHSATFTDLSWTETTTWFEPSRPAAAGAEGQEPEEPPPIARTRRLELRLKGPGWLRSESEEGRIRLAQGGTTVSIDPTGRFWVTPRQELIAVIHSMPNLSVEEAIRHLAGDVPGGRYLQAGLAVDVAGETERSGRRVYVIGATAAGARVAQLWVDAETGRPINLVEQIPTFRSQAHGEGGFSGIVETWFHDFGELGGGRRLPARLGRVIDGGRTLDVRLERIRFDRGIPDERFSLARLGGAAASPELIRPAATEPAPDGPGRAVPILAHDYLSDRRQPHPPYNSNPPTSGPRLRESADWGVHEVPVPLALQVHNLEQGGVVVQYSCPEGCAELVTGLERIVRRHDRVLLAPYPLMATRIALTAWGRIETLDELDEKRIVRFIEAYAGRDHHRQEPLPAH